MTSKNGVQDFLRQSLPEWNDDARMQARFRAFSTQDENFGSHFDFWRAALLLVASKYLESSIINTEEVRNIMFQRGGVKPLGLEQVLVEMHRRGQLQSFDGLMTSHDRSWIRWSVAQLARGAVAAKHVVGGLIGGGDANESTLDEEMVLMDLLKEQADKLEAQLSQPSGQHSILLVDPLLQSIHPNPRESQLILHEVLRRRKVAFVSTKVGDKEVRGVKVAARGEKRVPAVNEQDRQRLHLKHALQGLEERAAVLMQRATEARAMAHSALKDKNRALGVRCLRRHKLWERAGFQCADYAAKIEELLLQLEQAEVTKQVTSALQIGAQALSATSVTLREAESCMEQVDGALASHREVQEMLGPLAGEDASVDQDLAELEAEVALEGLSLDSAKKNPPKKEERADGEASSESAAVQRSDMMGWQQIESGGPSEAEQAPRGVKPLQTDTSRTLEAA